MQIVINVTESDIKSGEPRSGNKCAVALACKRAFPGRTIKVYNIISVYGGLKVLKFHLPPQALDFIEKFDRGQDVEPFSFETEDKVW